MLKQKLFEKPVIYIWLFLFILFLGLTYNEGLAYLLFQMVMISFGIYLIIKGSSRFKTLSPKIGINTVSKNSGKSFLYGSIAYVAYAFFAIFLMTIFQNYWQITPNFSSFLKSQSVLMGAKGLVLSESKFLSFIVFGFLVPAVETILAIDITLLIVFLLRQKFSLKSPAFWVGTIFFSSPIMLFYHLQVRAIQLTHFTVFDQVGLLLVFFFFMLNSILAAVTKEYESAIYLHQINNVLALLKKLGWAFGG